MGLGLAHVADLYHEITTIGKACNGSKVVCDRTRGVTKGTLGSECSDG
jgi:hypothetical protein